MTSGQKNRAKSSRGSISKCEPEVFKGGKEPLWLTRERQGSLKITTCFLSEEKEFR